MQAHRTRRAGFTLIELLAVILIVGILATILVTQLAGAEDAAQVQNTRQRMAMIEAVVDAFANEKGDAPQSSFTTQQGVANDGTNVGVEALVVALWSKGYEAGDLTELEDELVNLDGDSSAINLTNFETRQLLEIPDDWGNPIAYLHRRDYETKGRVYLTYDIEGQEVRSEPRAYRNPTTGRYYRNGSFQLVSAGSDGVFGTEDDITTFDRE